MLLYQLKRPDGLFAIPGGRYNKRGKVWVGVGAFKNSLHTLEDKCDPSFLAGCVVIETDMDTQSVKTYPARSFAYNVYMAYYDGHKWMTDYKKKEMEAIQAAFANDEKI